MSTAELQSGSVSRRESSSDVSRAAGSRALWSCRSRHSACTSAGLAQCVPTDGPVAIARNSASGIASRLRMMRLCDFEFNLRGLRAMAVAGCTPLTWLSGKAHVYEVCGRVPLRARAGWGREHLAAATAFAALLMRDVAAALEDA
jgi:hypothetical protein